MNTKLALVMLVPLLAPAASVANQVDRKDDQILADVSRQVLAYPQFTVFDDVRATVDAGAVTIEGRVTMPFKKTEIEKRVARVDGVRSVRNEIGVLPVSIWDQELRLKIARAIYGDPSFWHYAAMRNPPIHIVVENGHVTLVGVVNNNLERVLARSLASTFGAFGVENRLKTDAEMRAGIERTE